MKKLLVLIFLLLAAKITSNAQELSMTLSKDSLLVNGNYTYSISLKIMGNKAPYTLYLYDNKISVGGKLVVMKDNFTENVFKFDNLTKHANYFVLVQPIKGDSGIGKFIKL